MEQENLQTIEEVAQEQMQQAQESEQPSQEQQDSAEQQQQQQVQDERERNFAALREARERAERERDEAINYIRQLQQQNQPQEEEMNLAPDDLVEWKHVDKKIKKLENKLNQYENQTAYQVTEARIKSQFNDFDQVVTKENIEALRMAYPEIAQSLHATPDIYNKAVSTYNIIKKFGLNQNPNANAFEKAVVQRNISKPRPTNAVSPQQGDSPLNKANDFANGFLTDDRKAQLYKEMMEARSNY